MAATTPVATTPTPTRITLQDLADPSIFRVVWKRIRAPLRALRFAGLNLAPDPLDYVAIEWELARFIDGLCDEITAGTYQPRRPEVIRSAKSFGLTRPLAFFAPRDQLTYRVLTLRAENSLLASSYPWTRYGRGDSSEENSLGGQSGWFRAWLERQNQIWVITSTHEYLVETDVANFFPSVDTTAVARHVLANSRLGEDVVQLLEHMLSNFSSLRTYRASRVGGLPQEPFDGSRLLAHTYLRPVDAEFEEEGRNFRYSRWVDDIVIGATTRREALAQVRRAQVALERLDLHPNAAKTRIIRSTEFTSDYMKASNDLLGEIDEDLKAGVTVGSRFRIALQEHLRLPAPRPKAWEQVLRRCYTTARRLDDESLLRWWSRHVGDYPGSADHVFEYLSTYRLTVGRAAELRVRLEELGGVYEDVELLARHYLAVAPNLDAPLLRQSVADWSMWTLRENVLSQPRLASAATVVIGKFGLDSHLDELRSIYVSQMRGDNPVRQQTAVILTATNRLSLDELRRLLARSSTESVQHIEFLIALIDGDMTAIGRAIGTLQPSPREDPDRAMVRPRSLFLAPILNRIAPARWSTPKANYLASLQANRLRQRDLASERWLQQI